MRTPVQELTIDEEKLMIEVAKGLVATLPEGASYICLIMRPGGETGIKMRLCTSIGDSETVTYLLAEAAEHSRGNTVRYTELPKNN